MSRYSVTPNVRHTPLKTCPSSCHDVACTTPIADPAPLLCPSQMLIIPPQVSYNAQLPARANTARSMHTHSSRDGSASFQATGQLVWSTINVDSSGNAACVDKFSLPHWAIMSRRRLLTRRRPLPCPQLALYLSLAPEAKLTYPLGGPAAVAAFDSGVAGFEASAFRGLGVMTSTPVRRVPLHFHVARTLRAHTLGLLGEYVVPRGWPALFELDEIAPPSLCAVRGLRW